VLNGFSAAIIAYGQTGAGKTYTMQVPDLPLAPLLHSVQCCLTPSAIV
jgi:hypothetical protein